MKTKIWSQPKMNADLASCTRFNLFCPLRLYLPFSKRLNKSSLISKCSFCENFKMFFRVQYFICLSGSLIIRPCCSEAAFKLTMAIIQFIVQLLLLIYWQKKTPTSFFIDIIHSAILSMSNLSVWNYCCSQNDGVHQANLIRRSQGNCCSSNKGYLWTKSAELFMSFWGQVSKYVLSISPPLFVRSELYEKWIHTHSLLNKNTSPSQPYFLLVSYWHFQSKWSHDCGGGVDSPLGLRRVKQMAMRSLPYGKSPAGVMSANAAGASSFNSDVCGATVSPQWLPLKGKLGCCLFLFNPVPEHQPASCVLKQNIYI